MDEVKTATKEREVIFFSLLLLAGRICLILKVELELPKRNHF